MPVYRLTGKNGKVYKIQGPAGLSKATVQEAILKRAPEAGVAREQKSAIEDIPFVGGVLGQLADYPAAFTEGLAGTTKTLTDAANWRGGSEFLSDVAKGARSLRSAESREAEKARAIRSRLAEKEGVLSEVQAAARNFLGAPLETTSSLVGSAAPFIGAGVVGAALAPETGGASLIPVASMLGLGAVSGAGAIKGDIRDAVYEEFLKAGASEEQAVAAAEKAQEYGGKNLDQIALGTAIGALASATGFSRQIGSILGKRVAQRVGREATEKVIEATARKGAFRGAVTGAAEEALPEALQAGQERLAQNIALQREGFDVDTWKGVAGQAAFEGIASLVLGAYGGAKEARGEDVRNLLNESAKEFEAITPDAPDEEKAAAVARFVRRGLSEDEATTIVERMSVQKAALERAAEAQKQAATEAMQARTAGVDEDMAFAEPDITASGMQPMDDEVDPAEAARQQAYEEMLQQEPMVPGGEEAAVIDDIAQAAQSAPAPAASRYRQPTPLTPQRALEIREDPAKFSDFIAAGFDPADLDAAIEGEDTGVRYSRRGRPPKDTGTASMFDMLPLQEAPGEAIKRDEYNAQRFAPEEQKAQTAQQVEAEIAAAQEEAVQRAERDAQRNEARLAKIQNDIWAANKDNKPYEVRYVPDSPTPYQVVGPEEETGGREMFVAERNLNDFEEAVGDLTPYTPRPLSAQAVESGREAPVTPYQDINRQLVAEVASARDTNKITMAEQAALLQQIVDLSNRSGAKKAIGTGEQAYLDAMSALRSAETDTARKAAEINAAEIATHLRRVANNIVGNPVRAKLKSLVEGRQDERVGARQRVGSAKVQEALGRMEGENVGPEMREQREAKIDLAEAKPTKFRQPSGKPTGAKPEAVSVDAVRTMVDDITKGWKSTNPVVVVASVADIADGKVRRAILRDNAANANGFVTPDGTIYLVADNLTSIEDAKAVLFHEALGHLGLEALFRNNLDNALVTMYRGNAKLRADVEKWRSENQGAYERSANPLARAVEEVLAERSERGQLERTFFQKLAAIVRNFARRMGIDLKISDGDVAAILSRAHDKIVQGDTESTAVKGLRYVGADRLRVPPEAAKTFLKELGLFSNSELSKMAPEEATARAARIGIDEEWMDYFRSRRLAASAPEGSEPIKLPQPDMSRYMPKYSRPKTSPKAAKKVADADASMSEGLRRTEKTQSTYGLNDGLEEMSAGHESTSYVEALKQNIDAIAPPVLKRVLSAMPTSGILNWFGGEIPSLKRIDDLVRQMVSMKQRIILASDEVARDIDDFVREYGTQQLARAQSVSRINEVSPDEFASATDAIVKNAVVKEIEKRMLENSNDKARTRKLMDEVKNLVMNRKDAIRVRGDKTTLSDELRAKLKGLTSLSVDTSITDKHVKQLAEITRRIRDVYVEWDKLGKQQGGQRIYKEMRAFYKDMFDAELALLDERIERITDKEQATRLRDMRAQLMREIQSPEEAKKAGDIFWDIDADLFQKDYFPFMREGKYWLAVSAAKDGSREREFYAFDTAREMQAAQRAVAKRLGVDPEDPEVLTTGFDIGELQEHLKTEDALMQRVFDIVGKARYDYDTNGNINMKELTDTIYQTWLMTTPERSVRRRLMHAEEVVGFSQDVLLHFKQQATAYANQLAKLAYAGTLTTAVSEARDNTKDRPTSKRATLNAVISEFEARVEQEVRPEPQSALVNMLNRASYYYYLTGASTALIQTSSIPIRVVPRLWRDYGYAKGTAMWIKYMKLWRSLGRVKTQRVKSRLGDRIDAIMPSVNDSAFVKNSPDLQWAMKAGMERGILETVQDTIVQNERATPGKTYTGAVRTAQDAAAVTAKAMSFMFNGMENISRQATYYMTFELAAEKYRAENPQATTEEVRKHALERAIGTMRDTLGDYSNWERPRIAKQNLTRALFLFKMYAILQTKFMVGAMRDIWRGKAALVGKATPAEKAEFVGALKELSGVTMMAGMFGGLMGMPLYSVLAYALAQAFDEEDDDDVRALMKLDPRTAYDSDIMFRRWMMEKFGNIKVGGMNLTDILVDGPISALTGTELASRTGLDIKNMWFRDAVAGDSLEDTAIQTAIGNIAGFNMVAQMLRGYDGFAAGDNEGALKKMLPAFFRSWVAAAYEASEGVKDRRGNTIIPVKDIKATDTARSLLGFRSLPLSRWQDYYITRAKNDKVIEGEKKAILDKLERGMREGDIASKADLNAFIEDEVVPFNRTYPDPNFVITENTIINSLKRRAEVRGRTVAGMQLEKKTARKDYEAARPFMP